MGISTQIPPQILQSLRSGGGSMQGPPNDVIVLPPSSNGPFTPQSPSGKIMPPPFGGNPADLVKGLNTSYQDRFGVWGSGGPVAIGFLAPGGANTDVRYWNSPNASPRSGTTSPPATPMPSAPFYSNFGPAQTRPQPLNLNAPVQSMPSHGTVDFSHYSESPGYFGAGVSGGWDEPSGPRGLGSGNYGIYSAPRPDGAGPVEPQTRHGAAKVTPGEPPIGYGEGAMEEGRGARILSAPAPESSPFYGNIFAPIGQPGGSNSPPASGRGGRQRRRRGAQDQWAQTMAARM